MLPRRRHCNVHLDVTFETLDYFSFPLYYKLSWKAGKKFYRWTSEILLKDFLSKQSQILKAKTKLKNVLGVQLKSDCEGDARRLVVDEGRRMKVVVDGQGISLKSMFVYIYSFRYYVKFPWYVIAKVMTGFNRF